MKIRPECSEKTSKKKIVFSEQRSKLTLKNKDQTLALKVAVDGCQIVDGIKCDFLLIKDEIEYYIELKGQDIRHAAEQIKRTMRILSYDFKKSKKFSFIICTRSPLASPEIQMLQLIFKRDFNSDLIVRSSPFEYNI